MFNRSFVQRIPALTHNKSRLVFQIICKLEMEMVIAYGSLGYGYSHQVRGRHISVCVDEEEELILPIYYLLPS